MPLNIKLLNLEYSAIWKDNFVQNTNDTCMICMTHIMAPSPEDIMNRNLISPIMVGKCGHAFHSTCITNYSMKNVSCPVDMTQWDLLTELDKKSA